MRTATGLMLASVLLLSPAPALAKPAAVGKPAPGFTLKDHTGKSVSLKDFKGKYVVLEWVNPTCPVCVRHMDANTVKTLSTKYGEKGVVVLGVNSTHTQTAEHSAKLVADYALPYPVLVDTNGKVGKAYGAKTTPHMYVIDPKGILVYRGAIDSDPDGEATNEVNYVAQALDECLAGKPVSTADTKPYGCSVKYKK